MDRWWTGYVSLEILVSVLCVKILVRIIHVSSANAVATVETRISTTFFIPDSRTGHGTRVRRGTDPGKLPSLVISMPVQFDQDRPIAVL